MARDRAFRRAQTDRYKAKQKRDVLEHRQSTYEPPFYSDTRHHFDCGRRCLMCHGDKLIDGNIAEKHEGERQISLGLLDYRGI